MILSVYACVPPHLRRKCFYQFYIRKQPGAFAERPFAPIQEQPLYRLLRINNGCPLPGVTQATGQATNIHPKKQHSLKKKSIPFVPANDGDLVIWATHVKELIVIYGPMLGLTPAQVTAIQDLCLFIIAAAMKVETKRAEQAQAIAARNLMRDNELQQLVNMLIALKRNAAYTTDMGSELRIIGGVQVFDPERLKPNLKADVLPGKVQLNFNLQRMNCVSIYCRAKGTMGWEKLANDYESPYEDKRALTVPNQPEIREYMIRYFNGREDVGYESDIITVTFGG